ncbi:MAG: hypothetical protein K9K76_07655 [Halanaerobiales bacterium]|nr:hypothetical protein [Halanaerobiales bacterium]
MIGISFLEFLILLVIGIIGWLVIRYLGRKKIGTGGIGDLAMIIVGWLGAWVGSPVLGYWFEAVKIKGVYIIPALLGSLVAIILCVQCQEFHKSK